MALRPLAVGDDSKRGLGLAQRPDRFASVQSTVDVDPTAQVDDRHVEAADVADQPDRVLATVALVDLEVAAQRVAHAEPNQRVRVDNKAVWALGAQGPILTEPVRAVR